MCHAARERICRGLTNRERASAGDAAFYIYLPLLLLLVALYVMRFTNCEIIVMRRRSVYICIGECVAWVEFAKRRA